MNDYLLRLVAHMRWADTLVADALDDTNAPQPDADAARLFAHIAAAEHLWLARIKAQTPRVSVWPPLSPAEARALAAEAANAFEQLLSNADGDALARRIHYTNSAGKRFENTVSDVVLHVAMHGEHHRGQIARLIRAAGREPPYTDYIQFVRRAQPQ